MVRSRSNVVQRLNTWHSMYYKSSSVRGQRSRSQRHVTPARMYTKSSIIQLRISRFHWKWHDGALFVPQNFESQLPVKSKMADSPKFLTLAKFVRCMRINCYFPASDQHSDIAVSYSDTDFLKESNSLAIRRRFHSVTFTFDTWPWITILHRVPHDHTLYQLWAKLLFPPKIRGVISEIWQWKKTRFICEWSSESRGQVKKERKFNSKSLRKGLATYLCRRLNNKNVQYHHFECVMILCWSAFHHRNSRYS